MGVVVGFDWDRYKSIASYDEVTEGTSTFGIPTMYSPEGDIIFISSVDTAYEVSDTDTLTVLLKTLYDRLVDKLHSTLNCNEWSFKDVHRTEIDYLIVWGELSKRNALPDKYEYPEYYLNKALEQAKAKNKNSTK